MNQDQCSWFSVGTYDVELPFADSYAFRVTRNPVDPVAGNSTYVVRYVVIHSLIEPHSLHKNTCALTGKT